MKSKNRQPKKSSRLLTTKQEYNHHASHSTRTRAYKRSTRTSNLVPKLRPSPKVSERSNSSACVLSRRRSRDVRRHLCGTGRNRQGNSAEGSGWGQIQRAYTSGTCTQCQRGYYGFYYRIGEGCWICEPCHKRAS